MRRAGDKPPGGAAHLVQLLHQVGLGVQAARCIDDQHTGRARLGRGAGVVEGSRWIAARLRLDHRHAGPRGPHLKLFDRRRAKRVCRAHHHRAALRGVVRGQLACGGRLAGAVDAHHHYNFGRGRGNHIFRRYFVEHLLQLELQQPLQLVAALDSLAQATLAQALDNLARGGGTDVGGKQHRLQLRQRCLVHLARQRQHRPDRLGEGVARARHCLPHAVEEAAFLLDSRRVPIRVEILAFLCCFRVRPALAKK